MADIRIDIMNAMYAEMIGELKYPGWEFAFRMVLNIPSLQVSHGTFYHICRLPIPLDDADHFFYIVRGAIHAIAESELRAKLTYQGKRTR